METEQRTGIDNSIIEKYGARIGAVGISTYCVLCTCVGEDGLSAWPRISEIAGAMGTSEAYVKRALSTLEELGLIEIVPRYSANGARASNIYRLLGQLPSHDGPAWFIVAVPEPDYCPGTPRVKFSSGGKRGTVFDKTGGRCAYCGEPLSKEWHFEHVQPLAMGGSNAVSNLLPSCRACNAEKAAHSIEQYRGIVADRLGVDLTDIRFYFEALGAEHE
jgi:hypothetical protein